MGFFDMLFGNGMDAYIEQAKAEGATLLDVRTPNEFQSGHIRGAINIPVNAIQTAEKKLKDKTAPIYVYCQSGARSGSACHTLQSMGYTNAVNIGGIMSYHGELVRGNK